MLHICQVCARLFRVQEGTSNYIKGFFKFNVSQSKREKKRGRLGMLRYGWVWLGRLGRLGLCVCQTKNPMQRWVQPACII